MRSTLRIILILLLTATGWSQLREVSVSGEHPAIRYLGAQIHDPVSALNAKLISGSSRLEFDPTSGYLRSVLSALRVPIESQIMVFSKTSLQTSMIGPDTPRAIFFNDSVAVAYIRSSPALEVIALDPQQGAIFYTIAQERQTRPVLSRETVCLNCHETRDTLNVSGMIVRSVFPGMDGAVVAGLAGSPADHRTPFVDRWGGWYVSGKQGPVRHVGNAVVRGVRSGESAATAPPVPIREPLPAKFSAAGYPAPFSDIVALAVFEHQMHMMNLITRIGWEARIAAHNTQGIRSDETEKVLGHTAEALVDYLLFIDEAEPGARIEGNSGFAERFVAQGPFDRNGRSLRQLDLNSRLLRYPCSYMIYSEAFGGLPPVAKSAVYRRMWAILSGQETDPKYKRLSVADRKAIVEILKDTLKDIPQYFQL